MEPDQALKVKAYLSRQQRETGNERLRVAKAIQWYFFYGGLLAAGVFILYNYPFLLYSFGSVESYVIVISFNVFMYAMVFLACMTISWPYPTGVDQFSTKQWTLIIKLSWMEKIFTIVYYTFYCFLQLPLYIRRDHAGAIILAVIQMPHIVTSFLGFPTAVPLQVIGNFFRLVGLVFSFAHIHLSFIAVNRFHTLVISGVLGVMAILLLFALHWKGQIDKRDESYWFGRQRHDKTVVMASILCFLAWEVTLFVLVFYYSTPLFRFPDLFWVPLSTPFSNVLFFIDACVVGCMAIFSIPTLYYSMVKVVTRQQANPAAESTRLVDTVHARASAPPNFMNNIALIIACHKSRDTILGTLHAAHHLARFPLQNIYIAHNASNNEPIDDTGPVVWASEFRDVHYCHIPVGNKTIALHYVAENYVLPANIPYVVMIDDDVFLPADVDFKGGYEQIMNDNKVKAVAYTIRGTEGASFWQKFQHVEYMQAGLLKMFQAKHGTILACHGAISLWDVKAVCDVFQLHNSEFHGDDLQMGIILQNMKQEFRIEANAVGPVATTTPQSLLYEPIKHEKSLFSQRVLSWDMAAHHFFLEFIWLTFFNWEKCGLILKPFLIIELWTMVQDWVRFLFLAAMFHLDPVLAVSLVIILFILQVVIILLFDKMVLSHRPELQSPTYICVLYPIYNAITIVFRFIGLLYNAVYYTPWNPPRILIQERKKLGLIPPPVAEPIGVPAEREFYWKNVWKLSTYSNVAPPQDDLVRTITNILVTSASITVDLTDANNYQF